MSLQFYNKIIPFFGICSNLPHLLHARLDFPFSTFAVNHKSILLVLSLVNSFERKRLLQGWHLRNPSWVLFRICWKNEISQNLFDSGSTSTSSIPSLFTPSPTISTSHVSYQSSSSTNLSQLNGFFSDRFSFPDLVLLSWTVQFYNITSGAVGIP